MDGQKIFSQYGLRHLTEWFIQLYHRDMQRTPSHDRLKELIAAATRVFIRLGYRRAQMADIAREMGVAPGTLYLYVESKEALFHLALQKAVEGDAEPLPASLPLPSLTPEALLEHVRRQFF